MKPVTEAHWLYRIVFPNGKYYFWVSKTPQERFKVHCKVAKQGEKNIVYKAIRKYGAINLVFELLAMGEKEYIYQLEVVAIKKFKTEDRQYGYNDSPGGTGAWSRKAVENSVRSRKGKKLSVETRAKLSAARKKRTWSEETREKFRKAKLGKAWDQATKNKISQTMLGVSPVPERRIRSQIGVQKWWDRRRGINFVDEHYERLIKEAIEELQRIPSYATAP